MNLRSVAVISISIAFVATQAVFAQTVYVPGGTVGPSTNQQVGVGTTDPGTKLDVVGSIRSTGNAPLPNTGTGVELFFQPSPQLGVVQAVNRSTGTHLDLRVGPATFLTPQGSMGLGQASPAFKLDVWHNGYNAIRAGGSSSNSVGIYIQNTTAGGRQWGLLSSGGGPAPSGQFTVWDDTAQKPRFSIDGSGRIGVGTVDQRARFHLKATYNDPDSGLLIEASDTTNPEVYNLRVFPQVLGPGKVGYKFQTRGQDGGVSLPILLGNDGKVGIGAELPVARLHVKAQYDNANSGLLIDASDTTDPELYNLRLFPYVLGGGAVGYKFQTRSMDGGTQTPLVLDNAGRVGIGTASPTHKLSVNGTVRAKEVVVETTGWADYVFADDYRLMPLREVEEHITAHRHLPGIPSAKQVAEQGVNVGELQAKLLAKLEELTLHQIAQEKLMQTQQKELAELRQQNAALTERVEQLQTALK